MKDHVTNLYTWVKEYICRYIIISWKYYDLSSMCGAANVMLITCTVCVYLDIFNCSTYKCIQSRKMSQDCFLNVMSNNVIIFLYSNMRRDICYIYCPTNGIWYINRWIVVRNIDKDCWAINGRINMKARWFCSSYYHIK